MSKDLLLQPCNHVVWEGIEVPAIGCATNLAQPKAGARLYHQGPTARNRNQDNSQIPRAQDRKQDVSQQTRHSHHQLQLWPRQEAFISCPVRAELPSCQSQQGTSGITRGCPRGFAHQATANKSQLGIASQPCQSVIQEAAKMLFFSQ